LVEFLYIGHIGGSRHSVFEQASEADEIAEVCTGTGASGLFPWLNLICNFSGFFSSVFAIWMM